MMTRHHDRQLLWLGWRIYKPEEYGLIIAHFVIGDLVRTIAKKKCSDGTIRKELQTLQWGSVDGC